MFFFSSRRRHTRFDCDWSSDVCSSDLGSIGHGRAELLEHLGPGRRAVVHDEGVSRLKQVASHRQTRSEEHTSELQSQSNLACRLLLAKQNATASSKSPSLSASSRASRSPVSV